jgi:methylmalonyl-CoA mutase C-terminal domain/subunit
MPIFTKIFALLADMPDRPTFSIVAGGVMPEEDEEALREMGVAEVLGQDTTPDAIVTTIRSLAGGPAVGSATGRDA